MARPAKANADGTPKVTRPVGPKTLYIIFAPGTDAGVVSAAKEAIAEVTMNSRALIRSLQGGSVAPFLTYTIEVEKRGGGEAAS